MKAIFKLPENNIKANFSIPVGGGTYDYERLRNKPSINEVELIGNKTSEELGLASIEDIPTLQDLVTPEQLEAINSGATSTNIAQISTNAGNIILVNNTVSDLSSTVQSNYTILDNKIDTTQTTLQGNINTLSGTVTSNYNDLTQSITNNVSTLNTRITNEVSTLNGSITNEATTRQNADNNLQSQIDAITSASDVFDIVGTYAELQAYNISTVPVNDIIKVLVDSTHNNSATYYRCIETAGVKSWSYIGSEGAYYTKSEADGLFVEQTTTINNKPLSNNITLNASDVGALPSDTQIGNGTITLTQGGVTKGTFTLNQTGNATIDFDAGGSTITVDSVLSTSSTNPVQNKVITVELNKKIESITSSDVTTALGYTPYNGATNPNGYITSSDLPTNYVTTDTAQNISGKKTFLGEKAIYFKQQATTNKLGFTLYNPSNTELGALEYRPNTISGSSLLNLNCPQTTGDYVGFRYWGTPAINIVAPKPSTAGDYYIPTHITDGTNTVTASNTGTVNISSLLPDISTKQDTLVSGTNIKTINGNSLLGAGNITIEGGSGSSTLSGLSDVTLTSLSENQSLVYDATTNKWKNSSSNIPFYVTYGTTTYNEISEAVNQGRPVILSNGLYRIPLNVVTSSSWGFEYWVGKQQKSLSVSSSGWSTSNTSYQSTSYLVTSISSSSTNTQYPSARCVYNIVGNIETLLSNV